MCFLLLFLCANALTGPPQCVATWVCTVALSAAALDVAGSLGTLPGENSQPRSSMRHNAPRHKLGTCVWNRVLVTAPGRSALIHRLNILPFFSFHRIDTMNCQLKFCYCFWEWCLFPPIYAGVYIPKSGPGTDHATHHPWRIGRRAGGRPVCCPQHQPGRQRAPGTCTAEATAKAQPSQGWRTHRSGNGGSAALAWAAHTPPRKRR